LYDIGAHVGFFSVLGCRLVGPSGEVHCFEPLAGNIAALEHNLTENSFNACIHTVAVGDRDGAVKMTVGEHHITARVEDAGNLRVPMVQLDSLSLPSPDVIKIDVEGAEARALAGMQRTLREHRPVVIVEIHGEQDGAVRALLREAGYESIEILRDGGMPHLLARPS